MGHIKPTKVARVVSGKQPATVTKAHRERAEHIASLLDDDDDFAALEQAVADTERDLVDELVEWLGEDSQVGIVQIRAWFEFHRTPKRKKKTV